MNPNTTPFPLLPLIFLVFLVLKLTSVIDWSWWAVTAPLWAPFLLALVAAVLVGILFGVSWLWHRRSPAARAELERRKAITRAVRALEGMAASLGGRR